MQDNSLRTIFNEALDRDEPVERTRYLDQACGADAALRARVEKLLHDHNAAGGFLAQPAGKPGQSPGPTLHLPLAPSEKAGDRIGRYKLLQQIGEGGCGVVYMAEQQEPVRRKVALKVIKLGMDTKQVIARFEAERQALALMDHPNIARVLDAGATESGRPYFVMELVRGTKITEFCDHEKLSPKDRLELFIQVCSAIQHAHQKGIIHRDLKPSNILVTTIDGIAVPKVIDFGIAKATSDQRLTDKTLFTAFEQFIGTPAYMSPEQAQMSGVDIDTRTDIYSLGVVLYELLTGQTPFDAAELLRAGLDEIRRTIREVEPVKPSTRLTQELVAADARRLKSSGGSPPTDEEIRASSRRLLRIKEDIRFVRGDLDWVVMKCLEKDRNRRYETANGVAMDIQRHLNNEPVAARPASAGYRFQKLVRRNKLAFTAAAAVLLALLGGIGASAWQAIRATRAERQQLQLRLEADKARSQAEAQKLIARRIAYASDLGLAQSALEISNLGHARELLARQRPSAGEPDLRGWEWRYLWSRCQTEAKARLGQRPTPIISMSLSHDGQWVAVGEEQRGGLSIFEVPTRREIATLKAGEGRVIVAFSPREPLLAFAMDSNTSTARTYRVGFWDGRLKQRRVGELSLGSRCAAMAFSSDGNTLIILTEDGDEKLTLWRLPEGRITASYPTPGVGRLFVPHGFALSHHSDVAAYRARGGNICAIDLALGVERWRSKSPDGTVYGLAFSHDDRLIASGGGIEQSCIYLWDAASGRQIARLQGHRGLVTSLVFLPDGKTLASASCDQTIRLWRLTDLTNVPPPRVFSGHKLEVWRLGLLSDGFTLVSASKDGEVLIWDTREEKTDRPYATLPELVTAWRFSPDSQSVLAASRSGSAAQWNRPDFQQKTNLEPKFGEELRASAKKLVQRPLWLTTAAQKFSLDLSSDAEGGFLQATSPDGRFFAQVPFAGTIKLWEREALTSTRLSTQPRLLGGFLGGVHSLAFSPDSTRLAAGSNAREAIKIWDVETGLELLNLPASGALFGQYAGTAFSPDGLLLGSVNESGILHVWRAPSWAEIEVAEKAATK